MKASRLRKHADSVELSILASIGGQCAALLSWLCSAALAGCLFMSAGVPVEATTWLLTPSPVAPQEPTADRSQAVSSDSGI